MTGDDFFAPLPDLPANHDPPPLAAHQSRWPARRRRLARFVVDRNPFYLLSAVCMLVGCILLSGSSSYSPISRARLLLMLATINVYEAMLIGLAVWLIASRDLLRDGAILLGIEAFFLVDATWLNHEVFTIDVRLGAVVSGMLMIAATLKLAAIFMGLGIGGANRAFVLIAIELAILLAMPGVLRHISTAPGIGARRGELSPLVLYAAWWIVAALPVIATLLLRGDAWPWVRHRRIVRMFALFAFASIAIHLGLENWVYKVRWYDANLSPLAIGCALALGLHDRHFWSVATRIRLQLALPVVAVVTSLAFPAALLFRVPIPMLDAGAWMSPLRLVFIAALIVYVHGLFTFRHVSFLIAAAGCFGAAGLGTSAATIWQSIEIGWSAMSDAAIGAGRRMVPRTSTHWGVLSVAASFVLLVLGALTSVMKSRAASSAIAAVDGYGGNAFGGDAFGGDAFGGDAFGGDTIGGKSHGGDGRGGRDRFGEDQLMV